jgi:hypothetical protein
MEMETVILSETSHAQKSQILHIFTHMQNLGLKCYK